MTPQPLGILTRDTTPDAARTIDQFQSDATEIRTEPVPAMARLTLYALAAFVVFAVLWASVATIDRIVSAQGKVVTVAPNIVVQPFESAIVKSIEVRVGDVVKANSVLARLDPTFATADVGQIEARVGSLNAAIERLEAERTKTPYALTPDSQDEYALLQHAIWQERQTQYAAQMINFQEKISSAESSITARMSERDHLKARLAVLREVEQMRVSLEAGQSGSRLNMLLARDARIEAELSLQIAENAIIETQHALEALKAERDVFSRGWDSAIVEDLVTRRNDRDSLTEQLTKALRLKDMAELRTPVDAVVLDVAARSVGSVINSAEPMFRLVPQNAKLEVEAGVEARQLGHIAVGDPVQIKLDAYPYQVHGMVEGRVASISGDAFTSDGQTADTPVGAFYRVRVELVKTDLRNVPPDFKLVPGMPLSAEIKIGKRSVMSYLLRPILRGINESMREP
ncbi:HlyD family type I secretion periplasmic adaptor subunit [Novispirillum sp. DQ9]|uniref:HlyD family type I secretion periplasmic adaptor subunit n=1 Tax=Novispirillum sp. DQ9 TaxID=3398612 RepID=UPI003C7DFCFA